LPLSENADDGRCAQTSSDVQARRRLGYTYRLRTPPMRLAFIDW